MMRKMMLVIFVSIGEFCLVAIEYADFKAAKKAGDKAFSTKKWDEAVIAYQAAISKAVNPGQKAETIYQCGVSNFQQRKFRKADVEFEKILAMKNPPAKYVAGIYLNQGTYLRWCKRYKRAILKYEKILQLESAPDSIKSNALIYIALCYNQQYKYEEAISAFEKILTLKVSNSAKNNVRLMIAGSLKVIKKYDDALKKYHDLLNNHRSSKKHKVKALTGIAEISFIRDNYQNAASEYEKILEFSGLPSSTYAEAKVLMGRCFLKLNDKKQAKLQFETAQKLVKNNKNHWFKQAEKYLTECK